MSALAYVPATDEYPDPLIIAGGGDSTLKVIKLATGEVIKEFDVAEHLMPYIKVKPKRQAIMSRKNGKGKGKGKAAKKGKKAAETDDEEDKEEEEVEEEEEEVDEDEDDEDGPDAGKVLAITKILPFGKRDSTKAKSGVLVTAAG